MVRTVAGIAAPFIQPWITIGTYLSGLAGTFFGYGTNIVGGLIRGIVSMTGAVINAFLSLAGAVGARFAAALGIHSPSRVFMAMGAMSPMACGSGSMAGVMARPLRPGAWRWAWPQPVPSPSHRPAPLPCPAWVGRGQRAAPRMQPCRWQAPSRSPSRSTPRPAWM
jgi:hypothetical protein